MNIKLAWDFWFDEYKSLFPEIELFNWDKDRGTEIDLLVFPGGEDISLEYYASRETIRNYSDLVSSNKERDDFEFNLLDACYDGRIKVKKILGVCRGLQLLNVGFDGKLYPDLYTMKIQHKHIHPIYHKLKSNLGFLKTVNSMHHQGIAELGKYNRLGDRCYANVIATDENGYVPEIVTWDNDRVLGVQFHPEAFWNQNPDKIAFADFCYNWVNGKTTILP